MSLYSDDNTFAKYLKNRTLVLWGCGADAASVAVKAQNINLKFEFIDSSKEKQDRLFLGRKVYSPESITDFEKPFVIISTTFFKEISCFLEKNGMKRYYDYIDGLWWENEIALMKYVDIEPLKPVDTNDLLRIEKEMKANGINVKDIRYSDETIDFLERSFPFKEFYDYQNNPFYKRKMCEYAFAYDLLELSKYKRDDIYIDVGSSTTPWVKWLREKFGMEAYGVDLIRNPLSSYYYQVCDATMTPFENNSVNGISLQSAYCLFLGEADINFINECARILKPEGKVIISPLYMYPEFVSLSSPQHYNKGYNDNGSKEYIRRDWPNIEMSRYYDVDNLKTRVIDTADSCGLKHTVYTIPVDQVPYYEFAYLKFVLMLEK